VSTVNDRSWRGRDGWGRRRERGGKRRELTFSFNSTRRVYFLSSFFSRTWRIIRGHWDKPRWAAVKAAYQRMYGKSMASRVKGETTGDLEVRFFLSFPRPFACVSFRSTDPLSFVLTSRGRCRTSSLPLSVNNPIIQLV